MDTRLSGPRRATRAHVAQCRAHATAMPLRNHPRRGAEWLKKVRGLEKNRVDLE